jgi:dTDP-glucose 4,6-dehydratase
MFIEKTDGSNGTILVAGGSGFLGSHLCERLLKDGYQVLCVDNLVTGRRENIRHLLFDPQFMFLNCNVTNRDELESGLHGIRDPQGNPLVFNYVMHLASPASPKDYERFPIQTLQTGAVGTYNLLELAKQHGSTFLLASTSEVYGDPEISPQPESYWGRVNPIGPRSVYDEAKRFAEALAMAYSREWGMNIRIARIFNTYGERMRGSDGRVVSNLMMQALAGLPMTVYGDGAQSRSLCYVADTVDGLVRLLLSSEGEPVNIGNPDEVSILELAHEIRDITDSTSRIEFLPLPTDDPRQRCPDISRAANVLGWKPKVSRREGLRRVIPFFISELAAQSMHEDALETTSAMEHKH